MRRIAQVDFEGVWVLTGPEKLILRPAEVVILAEVLNMTKSDGKIEKSYGQAARAAKPLPEDELKQAYGGGRSTRRDLRGLVKTIWHFSDKIDELIAALDRLGERIDDLVNRQ